MSKKTVDQKSAGTDEILEIRPVTPAESEKMSNGFARLANVMQVVANAVQRQVATNLGIMLLHKHKRPEINISSLADGFSSRLIYSGVVTYPCLWVRKTLEDKGASQFAINFATASVDTAIGVPLEVNSSIKTLKLLGVDIAKKDLMAVSARAFFPFFIRNQISWCAINSGSQEDLKGKVFLGALAGAASASFHNIGTLAMENSLNKTWEETWCAVAREVRSHPNLFVGAGTRAVSIGASAIFLSPQTTEFLTQKCREIFGEIEPSRSPQNPTSEKILSSEKTR